MDTNNKLIANLEELSQTLFKRWFVDFEFPDENGNPYKSSGGKMIDSELGKIPNDWKISNFQEITAFNTEIIDTNQLENPLNYIGLEHISRNNIISIDRWENTSKVTGKSLRFVKETFYLVNYVLTFKSGYFSNRWSSIYGYNDFYS